MNNVLITTKQTLMVILSKEIFHKNEESNSNKSKFLSLSKPVGI